MGLSLFKPSGHSSEVTLGFVQPTSVPDSPDPTNFNILKGCASNGHLVVLVQYPNATNYEGMKILVYLNTSMETLAQQKLIDPHFFDKGLSPVARFEPTTRGWDLAVDMIRRIPRRK